MPNVNEVLKKELEKSGLMVKITSVEHVNELGNNIASLRDSSLLDQEFYNECLSWMDFNYSNAMPDAKSLLVVSITQYSTMLHFQYRDKSYRIPVPPTYVYNGALSSVEKALTQVASLYKFNVKRCFLPAKLLAVRTGLGMYGRNNICYIKGRGSFHRLFTFYSDMPLIEDDWQDIKVLPECSKCELCASACPTKCIDRERFLIHADKCLTRYNEGKGDFPDWVNKSWHNSIVGCMRCQLACPQNRDFIDKIDNDIAFTPEETDMILEGKPLDLLPLSLRQKLDNIDMTEYYEVLSRNLAVLIK